MRGVMETLETTFAFLAVIGIAWWVGTIYMSENDERLVQACLPVEFSTNALHHVTTALVGYPPRWTLTMQSYLMGGCYYFFSVMLPKHEGSTVGGAVAVPVQGGIRQE